MTGKIVYFAGKVSKGGGYRGKLLNNPRVMSCGYSLQRTNVGTLIYGGPFALSCDHGCFHRSGTHGLLSCGCYGGTADGTEDWIGRCDHGIIIPDVAIARCLEQIRGCNAVHCYIDTISCYGTLVELGYAASFSKPTYIYYKEGKHNWDKHFWFAMGLPNVKHCGPGDETSIHPDLTTKEKTRKERYHEYLQSPEWDERRKAKLKEAGYSCQLCNSKGKKVHVHHRSYDRVFHELPEDLIALCDTCHQKFHDVIPEIGG